MSMKAKARRGAKPTKTDNVRGDWARMFERHDLTVSLVGGSLSLYAPNDDFLRSALWNVKEGVPENPVEVVNWLLWYERNFLIKPVDRQHDQA